MKRCYGVISISNPVLMSHLGPVLSALRDIPTAPGLYISLPDGNDPTLSFHIRTYTSASTWLDNTPDCLADVYPALLRALRLFAPDLNLPILYLHRANTPAALNHAYTQVKWHLWLHATDEDVDRRRLSRELGLSLSEASDVRHTTQRSCFSYTRDGGCRYYHCYNPTQPLSASDTEACLAHSS